MNKNISCCDGCIIDHTQQKWDTFLKQELHMYVSEFIGASIGANLECCSALLNVIPDWVLTHDS